MKLHNAKEYLPLIQAWIDGKQLQSREGGVWYDFKPDSDVSWRKDPENYRIKPEPKLRPWKLEEVPVGALYRGKIWFESECCAIIQKTSNRFWVGSIVDGLSFDFALSLGEHSTDGGKTWKPCGVEE